MAINPTNDYVKFVRGSKAAFANLQNKADDTLYFIYDAANSEAGSLYLGSRLIGGIGGAAGSSLGDLTDIVLTTVGNKQILIYDDESKTWKNGSVNDIISVDNKSIVKADVGTLSLNNFEAAEIGSLAYKQDDGNLGWITPVKAVEVLNVYTKDEINNKLNQSLSRKIVNSVEAIDLTAKDAEQYIYLVPNNDNTYDEYIVVNGALEKVGDWKTDLSDYVTKAEVGTLVNDNFNTVVQEKIGDLSGYGGENNTLVEKITEIDDRLKWVEITDD